MTRFQKVLIANRGEIACRVIRTCRRLGYHTVAVYSEADRGAPHTRLADEAICIGPAAAKESYLAIPKILDAARRTGAQAIHPGYGFLSENEDFARACEEAGLAFVGPPAEAIELMGNKRQAKLRMIEAGVPCIPGFEAADLADEPLAAEGEKLGFPLMVKAAAGGGGRGIRLVREAGELLPAIRAARSEAENSFGSGELILERAIVGARHVEIQVFADAHGDAVHLGERDCSVQRRNQKIVEETPSAVDDGLRARMGQVAVVAAQAIGYRGAGTLEFLLAPSGEFYFMEMNTRLQVEHPVTELITGLDLVEWQLRVAAGEPLPLAQEDIRFDGHAIEVRLCAEDPAGGFLPQTGRLLALRLPACTGAAGNGLRIDLGVEEGQEITPYYDSMQAKVIAWGRDRDEARRRLIAGLGGITLFGVRTNRDLLAHILGEASFASGDYHTGYIAAHLPEEALAALHASTPRQRALAAAAFYLDDALASAQAGGYGRRWVGWNSSGAGPTPILLGDGATEQRVTVTPRAAGPGDEALGLEVRTGEASLVLGRVRLDDGGVLSFDLDDQRRAVAVHRAGTELWLDDGGVRRFADLSFRPKLAEGGVGSGVIKAPMNGRVLRVEVAVGQAVKKGAPLLVLEAMKLELSLSADVGGTITEVRVEAGAQVAPRATLVVIQPG